MVEKLQSAVRSLYHSSQSNGHWHVHYGGSIQIHVHVHVDTCSVHMYVRYHTHTPASTTCVQNLPFVQVGEFVQTIAASTGSTCM